VPRSRITLQDVIASRGFAPHRTIAPDTMTPVRADSGQKTLCDSFLGRRVSIRTWKEILSILLIPRASPVTAHIRNQRVILSVSTRRLATLSPTPLVMQATVLAKTIPT